jgi:hypothetical protein
MHQKSQQQEQIQSIQGRLIIQLNQTVVLQNQIDTLTSQNYQLQQQVQKKTKEIGNL